MWEYAIVYSYLGKMVINMTNSVRYIDLDYCIQQSILYESSSGKFKIISYKDSKNVRVKFIDTGYEITSSLNAIRKGVIKDRLLPSVLGVGFIGGNNPSKIDGKHTKEYLVWRSMLTRCYDEKFKVKYPTYKHCFCSVSFNSYDWFYDWCNKQVSFGVDGFELDKDLLVKGNKVYSEDTCVFLPKEINNALLKRDDDRGKCLIGVDFLNKQNKFRSRLNVNGISKHLGYFKTEIEAFNAYKIAKENYLKEQANKWKSQIDERAYEALMNYTVDIDD